MENSQTIFSMFYAVLYGLMLSNLSSIRPFPWGFPSEEDRQRKFQLGRRLVFSLVIFNIVPFFLFGLGYELVEKLATPLSYWDVVLSGLVALSVFAPYRLHHVLTSSCHTLFYSDEEWTEMTAHRVYRKSPLGHGLAVVFYLSPLFILWLF